MAKSRERLEELRVTVNMEGVPLTIFRNGSLERVTRVYQHRYVVERRWGKEVREYFTVKTSRGLVYDIYRDVLTNSWYLSQIHD